MTDESVSHIKPERIQKIGRKKCMYFHLFKIEPFINLSLRLSSFLPFFLLSLVILTSGAYVTCFFLIHPKFSTTGITCP